MVVRSALPSIFSAAVSFLARCSPQAALAAGVVPLFPRSKRKRSLRVRGLVVKANCGDGDNIDN